MKSQLTDFKVALAVAAWHSKWPENLVKGAADSCQRELIRLGVPAKNVSQTVVPGSLELPLVTQLLAGSGEWDAVIAFGLIIDAGVYRHEFVAQTVIDGMVRASQETKVPILSAVLTPQQFIEHEPGHMEFLHKHLQNKGKDAAQAAIDIIQVTRSLQRAA